jgi:hypothetical protein
MMTYFWRLVFDDFNFSMRAKTSKTFWRERKLAKEMQSSETTKLTGMRERVAAFFKFYDHASIFVWGAYGVPKSRVSDIS